MPCSRLRLGASSSSWPRWRPARSGIGAGIGPATASRSSAGSAAWAAGQERIDVFPLRCIGAQQHLVAEGRQLDQPPLGQQVACGRRIALGQQAAQQAGVRADASAAPRARACCARPARPATCTTSWASRSPARKSTLCRPSSTPTIATRVRLGRSCPLASIWVPTRIAGRSSCSEASRCSKASRRRVVSRSTRSTGTSGNCAGQRFLQPLGALPLRLEVARIAAGAGGRHALAEIAVMADQLAPAGVQGQRAFAARAVGVPAAAVAQQHRRIATTVAEHQRLLAAGHACRATAAEQRRRQAVIQPLRAHVDDLHLRRADRARARAQVQAAVATGVDVGQRLQRRRAGAQHDRHAERARAHQRQVAGVIAEALLLLVGGVVLLVDDDQAGLRQRREHRRARAEDDPGLAARARSQARARSPSDRLECSTSTATPSRSRRRRTVCGASPISGTSSRACRPCASTCSISAR